MSDILTNVAEKLKTKYVGPEVLEALVEAVQEELNRLSNENKELRNEINALKESMNIEAHQHVDGDDCDADHTYNYDFELKWDEATIQEFMKMYEEQGVDTTAEHFSIKVSTAETYYKRWKNE